MKGKISARNAGAWAAVAATAAWKHWYKGETDDRKIIPGVPGYVNNACVLSLA